MALFDFLKRKEEAEKAKEIKKTEKKVGKVKAGKKPAVKTETKKTESVVEKAPASKVKSVGFAYEAIKEPRISEKATYLAEKNQYIFEVSPNYNKNEIAKSVEGIYGVNVLSVNIIKIPAKKRRMGKTQGYRKAFKKAIIKIKDGQKIEIF